MPKDVSWVNRDEGEVGHKENVPEDVHVNLPDLFDVTREVNCVYHDKEEVRHEENVPQDI